MNIASILLRILAILGAVTAVVLFFILGDQKDQLQAELDDTQTRARQLEGQLSTARNERQEAQTQVETLTTQVEEAQAQNNTLQNQLVRTRQELAQAQQLISTREQEAEALRADANRIRRDLLAERNRIAELQQNLDEQDSAALRTSIRELERQLRETELRLQDLQQDDPQYVAQPDRREAPREALRGEVTEVGPQSAFVLLNIGSLDGVRENAPVMIRRGGRYIGRANVTEVHDEISVARVAPGTGRIRAGDIAVTSN
jgi:chromosome segregation ATPase